MASTIFRVSRTEQEGQPSGAATLNRAQDPLKIKIYDKTEDIDVDDLAVNEVVATVEEEPLANIHITDTVEDGNMNPVTSNAVHDAIDGILDTAKSYVDAKNSYSTEETLTGGTYIDGKPIYKRTWSFSSFSSTEGIVDSSGIYDKIISQQGFMVVGSQIIPVAQNRSADGITLRIPNISQHNLAYIRTTGVSSADITIEYTKTTD